MNRLNRLIGEIHRRSLWQVLGVYAVASWVIWQVVGSMYEWMGLPDWVPPTALVLLLIGLPVVLATAFIQEGAPAVRFGDDPLLADLDGIEEDAASSSPRDGPAPRRHGDLPGTPGSGDGGLLAYFTWRKAITGGVLAFAALGLATTGFMGMRTLGIGPAATLVSGGVLEARDPVVMADFRNATRDPLLAEAVTEALRIQLMQSSVLNLADRSYMGRVLARMERDPTAGVDTELAREIALREGLKAVRAGEVTSAGAGYVLSARLLEPREGRVLAAFSRTAADSTEVIAAIDGLGRELREKVGESLRTIRAGEPLSAVTTGSLAALRRYSEALAAENREDLTGARALLEEAIAMDPGFAMAWRKLAVVLSNMRTEQTRMVEAYTRAYELRDNLTERERYHTISNYHAYVTEDRDQAIRAYRTLLGSYPDDTTARHNLALFLADRGDIEESNALYRESIETLADVPITTYTNLVINLTETGRFDDAAAVLAEAAQRFPGQPRVGNFEGWLAAARGDYARAHEGALRQEQEYRDNDAIRRASLLLLIITDLVRGRLAEGTRHAADLAAFQQSNGSTPDALWAAAWKPVATLTHLDAAERAAGELSALLDRYPLEDMGVLDRPYGQVAAFYARAGRLERARELVDRFESEVPEDAPGRGPALLRARAEIAIAEGRPEAALEQLDAADQRDECYRCPLETRARALERLGDAAGLTDVYRTYVDRVGIGAPLVSNAEFLPGALFRLGELYEDRGDTEEAARHYGRFVELWADADPELQPRVREAQRRLAQLAREGR